MGPLLFLRYEQFVYRILKRVGQFGEKKPEVGRNGAGWVTSKKLTKVTNVIT